MTSVRASGSRRDSQARCPRRTPPPYVSFADQEMGTRVHFWEQNGNNNPIQQRLQGFRSDQGLVNTAFAFERKNGMEEVAGSIPTRSTI